MIYLKIEIKTFDEWWYNEDCMKKSTRQKVYSRVDIIIIITIFAENDIIK